VKLLAGLSALAAVVALVTVMVHRYGASGIEGGVYWAIGIVAVLVFAALVAAALEPRP
jgi:uncharacterized membrane protein